MWPKVFCLDKCDEGKCQGYRPTQQVVETPTGIRIEHLVVDECCDSSDIETRLGDDIDAVKATANNGGGTSIGGADSENRTRKTMVR